MDKPTVLVADPPWMWNDKLPGQRGAAEHLMPQSVADICAAPLPHLHSDAVLFLWRPPARLADALEVCAAWGFTYKTEMVWVKTTSTGKRAFGMGRIVRGEHETCIVATRGRPEVSNHSVRSTFSAPVRPYGKPDEFYDIVGQLYPTPYTWVRTSAEWQAGWVTRTPAKVAHTPHVSGFYTTAGESVRPGRVSARRRVK